MQQKQQELASIQPHQLNFRAREAKVKHADKLRVNVPIVSLEKMPHKEVFNPAASLAIRFCHMGQIQVNKRIANGDGQPLPAEVAVFSTVPLEPGHYNIVNALLDSNGKMVLTIDEETLLVPLGNEG